MVTLESLVPADHLLRKIDSAIDFGFIRDLAEGLYCSDNGRPPIPPEVLFKALFIGYLFGIRSERQLMREIKVNVAYRWFLGLRLTDKVFDASTFSRTDLDVKAVGLDAGYAPAPIAKGLEERDVLGVTGYLRPSGRKGMMRKREFTYDPDMNVYHCP